MSQTINIRPHTVVMTVGPDKCGKTTFIDNVLVPGVRASYTGIQPIIRVLSSDEYRRTLLRNTELERAHPEWGIAEPMHRGHPAMDAVSGPAFEILFDTLRHTLAFPIRPELVVIDSTGLSDSVRSRVLAIATAAHYHVDYIVFDYTNRSEYFVKTAGHKSAGHTITTQLDRLRAIRLEGPPGAGRDSLNVRRHRIRSLAAARTTTITVDDASLYTSCFLTNTATSYVVIGDVHENLAALCAEITRHPGYTIDYSVDPPTIGFSGAKEHTVNTFVLVGDYLDKGKSPADTRAMIEFLYANRSYFSIVRGNHEDVVGRHLFEGHPVHPDHRFKFSSLATLDGAGADVALVAKFQALYAISKPFLVMDCTRTLLVRPCLFESGPCLSETGPCLSETGPCLSETGGNLANVQSSFIVTHSPCHPMYLGKIDTASRLHQMRYKIPSSEILAADGKNKDSVVHAFLEKAAVSFSGGMRPAGWRHVFGHVAFERPFDTGWFVAVDSGAGHGYGLSSATFNPVVWCRPTLHHGAVQAVTDGTDIEDFQLLTVPAQVSSVTIAGAIENYRVDNVAAKGVNFISGTIAPAPADRATGEFESLTKAIQYYADRGVGSVALEVKYMGSRCQVYLAADPASKDNKAVSRNGFVIRCDIDACYTELRDRLGIWMHENEIKLVIIDGELMPWSALGKGLIDDTFRPIADALSNETCILAESGFEDMLKGELAKYDAAITDGFALAAKSMKMKDLEIKFGPANARNFLALKSYRADCSVFDSIAGSQKAAAERYGRQVQHYGATQPIHYKPFQLLKVVYEDGHEALGSALFPKESDNFAHVAGVAAAATDCLAISTSDPEDRIAAKAFFDRNTTDRHMEGIVIKPLTMEGPRAQGVAPCIKVRNEDYLSIIYGYDYQNGQKSVDLMAKKNVRGKIALSIREHVMGRAMLATPYNQLHTDAYKATVARMLYATEKEEKTLDPRL